MDTYMDREKVMTEMVWKDVIYLLPIFALTASNK